MTTSNATTLNHPTLESVQHAFDHWRNNRGQDKKIPEYLWKQVSQILPHYRQQKILSTLRLNYYQLRQNLSSIPRCQPLSKKLTDTQEQPADLSVATSPFVKVILPTSTPQGYHVEWQRPDGAKLIMTQLDAAGLSILMQQWEK